MFKKTGTTIVGLRYKNGIILCADTRSTSGPIVGDKNCLKIHKITDKIYCCGAGTAADTNRVSRLGSKELKTFEFMHLRTPFVSHFVGFCRKHLFPYQGHIGAALIVGGHDDDGFQLHMINPHGSSKPVKYIASGSGSLGATAILENMWKEDLDKESAIEVACEAVKAGILNDLYSGSNIDVCIIEESGVEFLRNYKIIGKRNDFPALKYPLDSVKILKEEVFKFVEEVE